MYDEETDNLTPKQKREQPTGETPETPTGETTVAGKFRS
jgi:hypothetical protein